MNQQSFQTMRRAMVESQLRANGVSDPNVIAAMATVPREWFVPPQRATLAYVDRPVPLGGARYVPPPAMTGLLLTHAGVFAEDRAMVIGAGTGYSAAVLAEIVASVVAVEINPALVEKARAALTGKAIEIVEGPLEAGHAAGAPFDLILVDGAIEQPSDALVAQLAEDGRLACVILERGVGRLSIGRKGPGGAFGMTSFADAEAPELPGFAAARGFVF